MSFSYAGSLVSSTPITRTFQVAETCYTGQLLMYATIAKVANAAGEVCVLDIAAQASEDDMPIAGICTGVHTIGDAGFSGVTGYGDTATADTTQAAQLANDPIDMTRVEVTLTIPYITLIHGPIYLAAHGTALTELVNTTADSTGVTVTHANDTAIDLEDDYGVIYCRRGANRGHYRANATGGTAAQVAGIAFPYGIALNDVFVSAPGVPGFCGLQTGGTANYIDGAKPINGDVDWFGVYLHQQNLEESGKEFCVFAFLPQSCGTPGFLGT